MFRCGLWASSGPFLLSAHYGLYKRGRDPPTNLGRHLKKERSELPLKWLLKEDQRRRPTAASAAAAPAARRCAAAETAASSCSPHVLPTPLTDPSRRRRRSGSLCCHDSSPAPPSSPRHPHQHCHPSLLSLTISTPRACDFPLPRFLTLPSKNPPLPTPPHCHPSFPVNPRFPALPIFPFPLPPRVHFCQLLAIHPSRSSISAEITNVHPPLPSDSSSRSPERVLLSLLPAEIQARACRISNCTPTFPQNSVATPHSSTESRRRIHRKTPRLFSLF